MSVNYTEFQPRQYRLRMPVFWWVGRRSYLIVVIRELGSIFVAWSVVFLLLLVNAAGQGAREYQQFVRLSSEPWMLALNAITLAFLMFHAISWFNLAPKAIVVRLRGERVPEKVIVSAHFASWAVLSVLVAWLILG
jgi:fumarate reductase subunit C